MPRVYTVKSARKAHGNTIAVGDTYYWWKFRYGGKRVSKTYPKPWQLTQSTYKQTLLLLEDSLTDFDTLPDDATIEDVQSFYSTHCGNIKSQIEELKDETEDALYNIPEHLQETHLLFERAEALQYVVDEFDTVDSEIDNVDEELSLEEVKEFCEESFNNVDIGQAIL